MAPVAVLALLSQGLTSGAESPEDVGTTAPTDTCHVGASLVGVDGTPVSRAALRTTRVPYVLSGALAVAAIAAAGGSFLFPSVLSGTEVAMGNMRGTALAVLVVGPPVLTTVRIHMRSVSIRAAASTALVLTVLFVSGCASWPGPDSDPAGMGVGQVGPDDNDPGRHMDRDGMGQGHMDRGEMGPDDNNRGRHMDRGDMDRGDMGRGHMGEDDTRRDRNGMMSGMPGMASNTGCTTWRNARGPDRLRTEVKGVRHGVS